MNKKVGMVLSVVLAVNLLGTSIVCASGNSNFRVTYNKSDRVMKIIKNVKKNIMDAVNVKFAPKDPKYSQYDVNKDGCVNDYDLEMIAKLFDQGKYNANCDVNGDKVVDKSDYYLVKDNLPVPSVIPTPVPTPEPTIGPSSDLKYDVNKDGVVDENDLWMMQYYLKEYNEYKKYNPAGDLNGDGVIDDIDYYLLKNNIPWPSIAPIPTPTPKPFEPKFDLNKDGSIYKEDLTIINDAIVSKRYVPACDLNADGVVDYVDYNILMKYITS